MLHLDPRAPRFDDRHYLRLIGVEGGLSGESLKISLGEAVVVGRSRACDLSLKKTPRYVRDAEGERGQLAASLAFRTTSRRHVRIAYLSPDVVEIENLSPNGTLVDGHLVHRLLIADARSTTHTIRLGPRGDLLSLSCGSVELDIPAA